MKICFVTPYSPKMVGGVGRLVLDIYKGLRKRNIDCIIVTKKIEKDLDVEEKLIEIPLINIRIIGSTIFYLKLIKLLIKYRREIDVLNLQTPFTTSVISGIVGKILGVPVVTTIHGALPDFSRERDVYHIKLVEKLAIAISDAVVSVDKRGVIDYKLQHAVIIENGIDTDKYQFDESLRKKLRAKLGIDDKFILLFLGRWVSQKGIYELLEALKSLNQEGNNVVLILIGSCDNDEILKKINEEDLKNFVIPIGIVENTLEFFCASDIFVLPSYAEGLPIAMLEAMACGLPVVVSAVGGIPYVVENFKDGILVKPQDSKDLIDKINWCLANPEELKKIGENAKKKIREKYSLDRMTDEYIKIFKKVTRKG